MRNYAANVLGNLFGSKRPAQVLFTITVMTNSTKSLQVMFTGSRISMQLPTRPLRSVQRLCAELTTACD